MSFCQLLDDFTLIWYPIIVIPNNSCIKNLQYQKSKTIGTHRWPHLKIYNNLLKKILTNLIDSKNLDAIWHCPQWRSWLYINLMTYDTTSHVSWNWLLWPQKHIIYVWVIILMPCKECLYVLCLKVWKFRQNNVKPRIYF